MVKLVEDFPAEGGHLLNLAQASTGGPAAAHAPDEVHVFVDTSNIMIGFFDTLKRARGIPEWMRVRRAPMSFHSLALILERARPAAKRVLAGSKPMTAEMQEAQSCGYELNILDRVRKARETTPRRVRYQAGGNATSGVSSGSDSAGPQRLVEQAVDEILHLKMLESLVDADAPATMVLATGDAAEAEYSDGFMRMVHRALEKGWRVELASFRQNTSHAYRRRDFRDKWADRFSLTELDAYAEELLDL